MWNFVKRHSSGLLALAFFILMTCLALDNLILHWGTAVPVSDFPYTDYAIFYWDLWWVKYALLNLHTHPLSTHYILFPNTVNLAPHTLVLPLGVLSLPFQFWVDLPWIVNGMMIASFLLSSSLMFIFLRRHGHNTWSSILGATLFAFSPGLLWRAAQVHLNTLTIWWLPLNLLVWDQAFHKRSLRWSVILGLCIYLAFLNHTESVFWISLTLFPYLLYCLFTQPTWRIRGQIAGLGIVVAGVALLPALVIPLPQLLQVSQGSYNWQDLSFVHRFSLPTASLFVRQSVEENNTLGQTLPVLVVLGLFLKSQRRQRWLWLAAGVTSLVLAIGPYWDNPSQPLPFMLLYNLTSGQYRTPIRLTTPASLALAVFVADSFAATLGRLRRAWLQPAIVLSVIAIYAVDIGILAPFPIRALPDYPVYRLIGADPEDHTLIQVPLGVSSGNRWVGHAEQLAYYARFHHQRTVNGSVSRVPDAQLDRYARSPFLRGLALETPLPPFEESRAELTRRLETWDIRYVVIHKDLMQSDQVRVFTQFFNEQPELCVFDDAADTIAYYAITTWPECPTPHWLTLDSDRKLDLGASGDERFIGRGWYDREGIGGSQARWAGEVSTSTLRLVLPAGPLRVHFRALAYPLDQVVHVSVNAHQLTTLRLANDWAEYEFEIPADALPAQGPSTITFVHALLESAAHQTRGTSPDQRPLAVAYDYFVFEPAQ